MLHLGKVTPRLDEEEEEREEKPQPADHWPPHHQLAPPQVLSPVHYSHRFDALYFTPPGDPSHSTVPDSSEICYVQCKLVSVTFSTGSCCCCDAGARAPNLPNLDSAAMIANLVFTLWDWNQWFQTIPFLRKTVKVEYLIQRLTSIDLSRSNGATPERCLLIPLMMYIFGPLQRPGGGERSRLRMTVQGGGGPPNPPATPTHMLCGLCGLLCKRATRIACCNAQCCWGCGIRWRLFSKINQLSSHLNDCWISGMWLNPGSVGLAQVSSPPLKSCYRW